MLPQNKVAPPYTAECHRLKVTLPAEDGPSFRLPLWANNGRFLMLLLSMLCMTAISANSLLLNFTVICMNPEAGGNFSSGQQGLLLAGTAIGGILAIGPVPVLISMFGLRLLFSAFGLVSGLFTALLPLLFTLGGFWSLMGVRILQGLCLMPAMPAMSQITHNWANSARREQALFLTLLSLYMQLGIILTMPVTGWLCASAWGWPSAYYLYGLVCMFLFLLFFLLYRNNPAQSPYLSRTEAAELAIASRHEHGEQPGPGQREKVPYLSMLTDGAVWACLSSGIGSGLAYWMFAQYGPIYMNRVLGYKVNSTGIWVAVPYFFAIFSKFLVPLLERMPFVSLRVRIVWFTFVCQLLNVLCFVLLGLCPQASPLLAQVAIILVLCANGAGFVALAGNAQVIARQHAHFILALFALINYIITLVQPLVIAWVASSEDKTVLAGEWSRVFFVYGALLFILNIFFAIGAGIRPRPWTGYRAGGLAAVAAVSQGVQQGGEQLQQQKW